MLWEIIVVLFGALTTLVLLLLILALPHEIPPLIQKHLRMRRLKQLLDQSDPPGDQNILAAIRLIRKLNENNAMYAKDRLQRLPASVVRPHALQVLSEIGELPSRDHWTLRILIELAGHPIPEQSAAKVFHHLKKPSDHQWELMSSLVIIGTTEAAQILVETVQRDKRGLYNNEIFDALETAFDLDQLDAGFRNTLDAFFAAYAEREPKTFSERDAELWLLVAPERATERLTRRPLFTSRAARRGILFGLRRISASIPEERLLILSNHLKNVFRENRPSIHPHPMVLWLLARIKSPRALPLIEELKKNRENAQLKEEGFAAEAAFAGILQPEKIIARHIAAHGYAASLPFIRHLWALDHIIYYLRHENLYDYFLSEHGDQWPDALIGLERAGYADCADVVKEALLLFGKDGPPTNHEARIAAVRQLIPSAFSDFKRLEGNLYLPLAQGSRWHYIMANAEFFRAPQPPTIRS